jgi:FkbM family methyltransferase
MFTKFLDAIRYHLWKDIESTNEKNQNLYAAILTGDRERIKNAIADGGDTRLLDKNGLITPLGKAVLTIGVEASNNVEIISSLLTASNRENRDFLSSESTQFEHDRPLPDLTKKYQIGSHSLIFPIEHPLDLYQSTCYRYDLALGYIAQIVFQKYPHACAIDIGANIGDSAALIQKYQKIPTLCIEGTPKFIKYLEQNAAIIGNIEIEKCFVGRDGSVVNFDRIDDRRGTASIVNAIQPISSSSYPLKSLQTILDEHPRFKNSKLLKIDTDGFDFSIIIESIDIISDRQPVIYFEYDISFSVTGRIDALNAISTLVERGYKQFIIYDNYGNYLMNLSSQETEKFIDLNAYLYSNHYHSGKIAVYYLDICAFAEADIDLFERIRQIEISPLDSAI